MARRVVRAARYALGDSTATPSWRARWRRRKASWTMSSVSATLPTIRYAMANARGRYAETSDSGEAAAGSGEGSAITKGDEKPAPIVTPCEPCHGGLPRFVMWGG